jgi:ribonuclease P protein component
MLAKAHRLTARQFSLVMERGRQFRSPFFILTVLPADSFRLSAAAPRKAFRTAVSRTSARRRMYAMARELISGRRPHPVSAVLLAKEGFGRAPRAELVRSMDGLFVKAGLFA